MKEGAEGRDLKGFLEKLFRTYVGFGLEAEVKLKFAYRVRGSGRTKGKGRDREVLIGFEDWSVKSMVLDALWEQCKIATEGQELTFYSDLCSTCIEENKGVEVYYKQVDQAGYCT